MSFSRDRRRRRRRRVLIGAGIVALLLAVAYGVTRYQSVDATRRQYLDTAVEVANGEEELAGRFDAMVEGLDETERTLLVDTLDYLEETVNLLVGDLSAVEPSSGLIRASVYLDVAVGSWRDGIEEVRNSLMAFADSESDPVDVDMLTLGLTDLRTGDAAYARFLEVLDEDQVNLEDREFPVFAFIPDDQATMFAASGIVNRLLLSDLLGAVRDLAVSDIRLDPGFTGDEGGLPVVPFSEQLDAAVTIANRGTVTVPGATVKLEVLSTDSDYAEFEQQIGELQPEQLTAVKFENLPVIPGKIYEVTVSLPDGDDNRSNDSLSIQFKRNENS